MNTLLKALIAAACLATTLATAQTPEVQTVPTDSIDLASAEMGGRIEWVTSQNFSASGGGAAMNLIATTPHHRGEAHEYGWSADSAAPQDIVFSFFSQQSALVASVLVNPMTAANNDRPKDVEIWVSALSPVEGFTKIAAATLTREDSLQPVTFTPVEARFVKLRVMTTTGPREADDPGSFVPGAKRVKILEGARTGYQSILARNPALAALAKGELPAAPPAAALSVPPADEPAACEFPHSETPKPSTYPQSKQVLVLAPNPTAYRTVAWKSSPIDTSEQQARPVVPGVNYTWMPPSGAAPAHLISEPMVDTVILAQVCVLTDLSDTFKQALFAWIAAGHKLIIQDSDFCSGGYTPNYDFMPYPFATVNPGAFGSKGEAGVLENSTLASNNSKDKSFIDTDAWKNGPNDLGDSNVIVQYDARWCGAMWAKNRLQKNGMALAYARYGRGLIIYNGFDADQFNSTAYGQLVTNELLQPFDGDYLPCSQPMGDFIITAPPAQKSQWIAAGRTYTYPVSVLGNFGYSGSVTLDASITPADSGVSVKLDTTTADLTSLDEALVSLTVTASPTASIESKVVTLRGRDATGKSNVLCLELPQRRSGSVLVASGLQQDSAPTRNIEIILDASGSMKVALGNTTRWATAIDVLQTVVEKLPPDFSVGLRAYGHKLSSKDPNTCTDSALVVPVGPLEPASLMAAARQLAPRGETPLVYSILQTPADLQTAGGGTVILITDGEESCKGDFASAQDILQASAIELNLNIVGFTLNNAPAEALLTGLAESTGGHYYGAANGEALAHAVLLAAVDRLPYRILDAAGTEVAQGEAGTTSPHELAAGDYTVVITAAGEELRTPVNIEVGKDIVLKALIKNGQLVVETSASAEVRPESAAVEAPDATTDAQQAPAVSEAPAGESPQAHETGAVDEAAGTQGAPSVSAETNAIGISREENPQAQGSSAEPAAALAESAPADNVASTAPAVLQEDGHQIYDAEVMALRDRLARLQSYLDGFPGALTDVSALAREHTTPEAAFNFVRDQIAFEPYPGLMKGARGTLVTRGGNALDRALLLAAVLRCNGISARIAHARLADGQRRQLLGWITTTPGATGRMLATLNGMARPSPATPEQQ